MRYGLQMYGPNPLFLRDKEAFLCRVAASGCRYLEPCLMLDPTPDMSQRAWTPADLEAYHPLLERLGLTIHSCHVFTQDLYRDLPRLIPLAKEYGIRQLVLPCPKEINPAAAVELTRCGDILLANGIQLLIHNDKGDFGYGWLLSVCGDSVGAQVDVGWLRYNGTDPETFLWKFRKKIHSLHYKDFDANKNEVGIGRGTVDLTACFQFGRAAEVIQILDQDSSQGDFLADVEEAIQRFQALAQSRDRTKSILCTLDIQTGEVTPLRTFDRIIEAPNWLQTDPNILIYNSEGRIWKYDISNASETLLDTGHCTNCNNDHVLSPEGSHIAVSHSEQGWMSQIYILPLSGGQPRLLTPNAPSYLHGWSPDGKELAYCAFRDRGNGMEVDVYAIDAQGGEERQLTENAAFNDGPEYAPDGQHIWFNSTRSGLMQCWRMNRDGSDPVQITHLPRNNWFPHVSPDGERVVYLSYSAEGLDPKEHLPNMQVQLRLINADGTADRLLLEFFGGQGSINVNSWHPDSRRLAFVMYELDHR